tara:strand:- start:645 stop:1505 length:861 start_codon:yes stop_codon:yes gene_type:complete
MNGILKDNEINKLWNSILDDENELYICTVATKNISNNFAFFFRNRIIKYLAPKEAKIINLEFDLEKCKEEVKKTQESDNSHTIHSYMITECIKLLNKNSYCLLIDLDAFPLNQMGIKTSFSLAKLKGINGNMQRTNCINNNKNIFIAESYMCFSTNLIKPLGDKVWRINYRSDVSEELSWIFPELIDRHLFRPIKTIFKPIWYLRNELPEYGIGTTFAYNDREINYHHFYARNFISRFHFFLISFKYYLKIIIKEKISNKKAKKNILISLKNEVKFSLKYIFGKID